MSELTKCTAGIEYTHIYNVLLCCIDIIILIKPLLGIKALFHDCPASSIAVSPTQLIWLTGRKKFILYSGKNIMSQFQILKYTL
jgi:hypothetical protein